MYARARVWGADMNTSDRHHPHYCSRWIRGVDASDRRPALEGVRRLLPRLPETGNSNHDDGADDHDAGDERDAVVRRITALSAAVGGGARSGEAGGRRGCRRGCGGRGSAACGADRFFARRHIRGRRSARKRQARDGRGRGGVRRRAVRSGGLCRTLCRTLCRCQCRRQCRRQCRVVGIDRDNVRRWCRRGRRCASALFQGISREGFRDMGRQAEGEHTQQRRGAQRRR